MHTLQRSCGAVTLWQVFHNPCSMMQLRGALLFAIVVGVDGGGGGACPLSPDTTVAYFSGAGATPDCQACWAGRSARSRRDAAWRRIAVPSAVATD